MISLQHWAVAATGDSGVLLVLVDFSKAFCTLDHQLLPERVVGRFGTTVTAIAWSQSSLGLQTRLTNKKRVPSNQSATQVVTKIALCHGIFNYQ